jgi:hypothetical protein
MSDMSAIAYHIIRHISHRGGRRNESERQRKILADDHWITLRQGSVSAIRQQSNTE